MRLTTSYHHASFRRSQECLVYLTHLYNCILWAFQDKMPSHLRFRERLGLRPKSLVLQSPTQLPSPGQPANLPFPPPVQTQLSARTTTVVTTSGNRALDKAIHKHLQQLPQSAQDAFSQASKQIDPKNLLASIKSYDDAHRNSSRFDLKRMVSLNSLVCWIVSWAALPSPFRLVLT